MSLSIRSLAALVSLLAAASMAAAQDGGISVNPSLYRAAPPEPPPAPIVLPRGTAERPVWALASAIGGQLSYTIAKETTGSNLDPYERRTLPMPDTALDAIVLRGLDRVIQRRAPQAERVYMRLNPMQLDGVPAPEREKVALERLKVELAKMPERSSWERIVVLAPHYRAFEVRGLGSKLHGVGVYVQNLNNESEYDVVEPDGTPGAQRRSRFLSIYYFAMIYVLDAKSLAVLESQPWLIDEKIHDSKSDAINIQRMIPPEILSARLETFVEKASDAALARTLGGMVVPEEPRVVGPAAR